MKTRLILFAALALALIISLTGCGGSGSSGGGGGTRNVNLSGHVQDTSNQGISNASVSLKDMKDYTYWSAASDTAGNYSGTAGANENVNSVFTASKSGYSTHTENVTISPGGSYVINATLKQD